ncbi:MAG: CoA transferase [Acidimicrobiia bacterium]|nr:CoA transferase [Acidimicrobiia bacterium]
MPTAGEIRSAVDPFWRCTGTSWTPEFTATEPVEDRSAFRTGLAASASCAAVIAAIAELTGRSAATIDQSLALASFTTHALVDRRPLPKWASLSGFYRTADDRFIQLHCNFPHHGAGAAARLGVEQDRDAFEAAIAGWNASELESALIADGMVGAMYRTMEEWSTHPHARATADLPIVDMQPLAHGKPKTHQDPAVVDHPLSGVRVLDCTRVLAGPVAGQTLANLGADVLRVGAEHLPHVEVAVIATGTNKRNAFLDLRERDAREHFANLVSKADVVIDAFRPGALEHHGFGPREIAAISPATSVIQICAFDWVGPWAGRRGFDSIVQSTTGIALAGAEMSGTDGPAHLPVQSLDYATGFFAAAAAIRAVHRTRTEGDSSTTRLSLLRTRNWLVGLGQPRAFSPGSIVPTSDQTNRIDSDFGEVELVRPFVGRWTHGPQHLGSSSPRWL